VPVLLRESEGSQGTLVTHVARANAQWRHFAEGGEALVIFTGPHAYISPAWYASQMEVPTWNYTAVHVYGRPRIIDDHERFGAMLRDLVEEFEAPREERWPGVIPDAYRDKLMAAIVGLEIEITRIEGKFKLSQNKPAEMESIIAALAASGDQTEREVAAMMKGLL
jgi:transcriptional regulator